MSVCLEYPTINPPCAILGGTPPLIKIVQNHLTEPIMKTTAIKMLLWTLLFATVVITKSCTTKPTARTPLPTTVSAVQATDPLTYVQITMVEESLEKLSKEFHKQSGVANEFQADALEKLEYAYVNYITTIENPYLGDMNHAQGAFYKELRHANMNKIYVPLYDPIKGMIYRHSDIK